jgi:hypothetical protein
MQPFRGFQFGDTNRRRGASIQAALDQPHHNKQQNDFADFAPHREPGIKIN